MDIIKSLIPIKEELYRLHACIESLFFFCLTGVMVYLLFNGSNLPVSLQLEFLKGFNFHELHCAFTWDSFMHFATSIEYL